MAIVFKPANKRFKLGDFFCSKSLINANGYVHPINVSKATEYDLKHFNNNDFTLVELEIIAGGDYQKTL